MIKLSLLLLGIFTMNLLLSVNAVAEHSRHVYTIGAYDEAFAKHAIVTKLGPLPADQVSAVIPKSFLEKDGRYGGGEAFCTIQQACRALKKQLASGVLPKNMSWHIYLLNANWDQDTYLLHPQDFRIKHALIVLKQVKHSC